MKVYFSKSVFYIGLLIIIVTPVSQKWELFLFGERTTGEVIHHSAIQSGFYKYRGTYVHSIIEFKFEGQYFRMRGPENVKYKVGEQIDVIFNKNDPKDHIIPSFLYLYTGISVAIPGLLLLVWFSFYYTFKTPKKE